MTSLPFSDTLGDRDDFYCTIVSEEASQSPAVMSACLLLGLGGVKSTHYRCLSSESRGEPEPRALWCLRCTARLSALRVCHLPLKGQNSACASSPQGSLEPLGAAPTCTHFLV